MKHKFYLFALLLMTGSLVVQSQSFSWAGTFGGDGEDVIKAMHVDDEGNIYTTGYFTDTANFDLNGVQELTSNGFYDAFVQKTNSDGNFVWAKSFGAAMFDLGTAITVDSEGNVYIAGSFEETVDFNPDGEEVLLTSIGMQDIFIIKLNANGDFIWAKTIGSVEFEEVLALEVLPNGNLIAMGFFYQPMDFNPGDGDFILEPEGSSDIFLLQLDGNGDFITAGSFGGENIDLGIDLALGPLGEIYVAGYFKGTADLNPSPTEEFIVSSQGTGFTAFLLQLNNNGEFMNAHISQGGDAYVNGLTVDNQNNAYLTGYFSGTVDFSFAAASNPDFTITSELNYNGYVLKIDPMGNAQWVNHLYCDNYLTSYDVAVTSTNNVVITGYFSGNADFDSSDEEFILVQNSGNATDAFLKVMDTDGNFINAFQFGGVNFIDTNTIGIDAENNIYTAAHFEATVDVNPLPDGEQIVNAIDFRDNYIIKLQGDGLAIDQINTGVFSLYPNPTKSEIYFSQNMFQKAYRLINNRGIVVKEGIISESNSINLENQSRGIYFLEISGYKVEKILLR